MRIAGDSVAYDEQRQRIQITGKPGRVHDPGRTDDIAAYKPIYYYLDERRGTAGAIETAANSGSIWYLRAELGAFSSDSTGGTVYGKTAELSTDSAANPHYHFEVGEMKKSKNWMYARPAVLYIGEVPVLWIPWLFQDMRKGRRTGILTPRFTFAELLRNSTTYRRGVDNLGFYLALSNYYDAEFSLDWRSGARPTTGDPGFVRLNGNVRYAWLDRFLNGSIGVSSINQFSGSNTLNLNWTHTQQFSKGTSLGMNINYTTNTTIQQQTTINPLAVMATIGSMINYQTHFGPFAASFGASQTQYPGRGEVDRNLPTISLTTKPIQVAPWLTWSPTFNTQTSQNLHMDTPSEFAYRRVVGADGRVDSVANDRNSRNTTISFGTPFKLGPFDMGGKTREFTINARLSLADHENDFPEAKLVIDPSDTSRKRTIVYARTYITTLDWDLGMNLPQFSSGKWNLTPSITLRNVDPGAYLVRSERTGAAFASQSKRLSYGLGVSPTFYHVTGAIGPFQALRHSITPVFSYSYSPQATVSDAYLGALGRTRAGYLGANAQNRVSLSLNTVLEGKLRDTSEASAAPGAGRKLRLLSLQASPIEYDFERARVTGRSGFATDQVSFDAQSDLLPGLSFNVGYSLFDAPVISDTARFSPYLESVRAQLTLGQGKGGPGLIRRIIGWATGERPPARPDSTHNPSATGTPGQLGAAQVPGAGQVPGMGQQQDQFVAGRSHPALQDIPTGRGWNLSLSLSSSRPRPPHGANVIALDPRASCEVFRLANPIQYDICLRQQTPLYTDLSQTSTTGGGRLYSIPPTTSINGNLTFNLTTNWAASWQTSYDAVRHEFASQIVSLQRDLHDWRAMFGFQQAPNGNFAFNFLITLKPAPDLNFPYNQRSYRANAGSTQR